MLCRPWFSDYMAAQSEVSREAGQPSLPECDIEGGRAEAQAFFAARGLPSGRLSTAEYGLARAVYSEAGGGTGEEKVVLSEGETSSVRITLR